MYQPHRLNSSRLVLLLQQWTQPQGGSARQDVAEQLSQWLSTVDAVKLSRALHALESSQTPAVTTLGRGTVDVRAMQASLQSTRAELTDLVTAKAAPAKPVRERADNTPVDGPDPEAGADFAVHAARYLALQKQMDARLAALRALIRQSLSMGPEGLRRLALLDAVMDQMLGAREQRLWASLPGHLERRMAHLRAAHQQQGESISRSAGRCRAAGCLPLSRTCGRCCWPSCRCGWSPLLVCWKRRRAMTPIAAPPTVPPQPRRPRNR